VYVIFLSLRVGGCVDFADIRKVCIMWSKMWENNDVLQSKYNSINFPHRYNHVWFVGIWQMCMFTIYSG
jgi:hypothetical protein